MQILAIAVTYIKGDIRWLVHDNGKVCINILIRFKFTYEVGGLLGRDAITTNSNLDAV